MRAPSPLEGKRGKINSSAIYTRILKGSIFLLAAENFARS
jgi:hypothetical protein